MAELARGSITDRPWGKTLGALALRGLSGQLDVASDGKTYSIAFARGAVVAAASPLATDSAVRVAVTSNLVSTTQVSELTRRLAADPKRDEIDVIADVARLSPEQALRLRRRTIGQRAARTFSLEHGEFVVRDSISLGFQPGNELDIRGVIYLAARANLSEPRLVSELGRFGGWFQLRPDALEDLHLFGFTDAEQAVLHQLSAGAAISDLLAADPASNTQGVRAIVYSLACMGACDTAPVAPGDAIDPPTVMRRPPTADPHEVELPTVKPKRPPTAPGAATLATLVRPQRERPPSIAPVAPVAPRAAVSPPGSGVHPRPRPAAAPPPEPPPAQATSPASKETHKLITELVTQLDRGVDHFALLGVAFDAPADLVRTAYFSLARKLHPDRLAALGVNDNKRDAQRLFAQINTAFAVLSDPKRREEYVSVAKRGGESAVRADDAKAEDLASRVMQAEEAFRMGEMALRRDQLGQAVAAFSAAVELQPNEPEYQALLAWAKFASADNKAGVAAATRSLLQKAIDSSDKSPTARFYLGRVERMLGREKEALAHFQEVLRIKPNHADASSEARVLEQRLRTKR